jgi:hypothetical protein
VPGVDGEERPDGADQDDDQQQAAADRDGRVARQLLPHRHAPAPADDRLFGRIDDGHAQLRIGFLARGEGHQ